MRERKSALLILSLLFWVIALMIVGIAFSVFSQTITILLGLIAVILVAAYPLYGFVMVMALLYLPVFSLVRLGPLEFSVTSIPIAALAGVALLRLRDRKFASNWKGWQIILLTTLAIGFFVSTALSTELSYSWQAVPNLIVYLLILFSVNSLVTEQKDLLLLAKATVVLAFVSVIWKEVDGLIGLPRLTGINGINFQHHVAFALCLGGWALPIKGFSVRWKVFMALVASSIIVDYVYYETRGAWIAGLIMVILVIIRARPSIFLTAGVVGGIGVVIAFVMFGVIFQRNLSETRSTIAVLQGAGLSTANPDDQIRLVAQQAGLNMIRAKPWFGWGPNLFKSLKSRFVMGNDRTLTGAAFNSWLTWLAEMGIFGTLPVILAFLVPFLIIFRHVGIENSNYLAYALSVGMIGLVVHLFFINMLYSFTWFNIGLSWAAAGIVSRTKVEDAAQFM